jgi:B9 domain-containing protein 1
MQTSSKADTVETADRFFVMVNGQVESAEFQGVDNLYCRYCFNYGSDWSAMAGVDVGLSQIAQKANGHDSRIVWNFPIDIVFKSTNPFGWPRLVLSVYGIDGIGRDVVQGYGCVHVPAVAGTYTRHVRLFKPKSSSVVQGVVAWFTGQRPEFFDPKFVSQGEGREVTRVSTSGVVTVKINVMTKNMASNGYTEAASTVAGVPNRLVYK